MRNACRRALDNDYIFETRYEQIRGVGRKYAQGDSLQKLPRIVRNALLGDTCYDFDMENCHPKLLEHICKKHNIPCPAVSYYNNHREECLNEIIAETQGYVPDSFDSRGYAEQLFLKAINKQTATTKHAALKQKRDIKSARFLQWDKELKDIQIELGSLFPEFLNRATSVKDNKLGTMMSMVLQDE